MVEKISAQELYISDRDIQLERAKAWRNLAFSRTGDPIACQQAVEVVESITAQEVYLADRDMQLVRAEAGALLA